MRLFVLYAHPEPASYVAALKDAVIASLTRAGHEIDLCDLYAEGFDPVLSRAERAGYHSVPGNRAPVEAYVERLLRAEGIVLVFPVWNFGFPAILKGFLDRVFLPGVSFRIDKGRVAPNLRHMKLLAAVTTYGASRWRAFVLGDPIRKAVLRMLGVLVAPNARRIYLAHYDMNRSTQASRADFLSRVATRMGRV